MPNTGKEYGNYFFFVQRDASPFSQFNFAEKNRESTISLIVYANLKRIDADKDYDFTNELIEDVLNVLPKGGRVGTVVEYRDPLNVWEGYTLEEERYQTFTYPFTGFRIDFVIFTTLNEC